MSSTRPRLRRRRTRPTIRRSTASPIKNMRKSTRRANRTARRGSR